MGYLKKLLVPVASSQITDITFSGLIFFFVFWGEIGQYIIQLRPVHILKTPVEDEEPSRSPEDERVQRLRHPESEFHQELSATGEEREKGDDEKWMYVVDMFHMELSLGATILDLVPKSKIPLVWPISRRTRELTTSLHLQFLFSLPLWFYITFHIPLSFLNFRNEMQGTFV